MTKQLSYNPLFELMDDKEITKNDLRVAAKISTSTWAGIQENKSVTMDTILKLCTALSCRVEDIVKVV